MGQCCAKEQKEKEEKKEKQEEKKEEDMKELKLPTFEGKVFIRGDVHYEEHRYQYATSSFPKELLSPQVIIYPKGDDDVVKAIDYARNKGIAISVRSGGHQYCGMSSTNGENIQLDMSETYRRDEDFSYDAATNLLRCGISFDLGTLDTKIGEHKVFVPHGQCAHVHLGGHVQTGGYGVISRGFGLLGDHVVSIEMFTADSKKHIVTKESDPDLFYAVLGGSPGNYGILTHVTLKPHKDVDHPNSRGLMVMYWLTPEHLKKLLDIIVEMVVDEDFPADYDFCVSAMSPFIGILEHYPSLDNHMRVHHPDIFGKDVLSWPPIIMITVQFSNLGGAAQPYDPTFFNKIKATAEGLETLLTMCSDDEHTPISKLNHYWVTLPNPREFNLPYEKRTYDTKETQRLVDKNWSQWVVDRIHHTQGPVFSKGGTHLVSQFQPFGGKQSRFYLNRDNGTAYSWRDATLLFAMDNFYQEGHKEKAENWCNTNDKEGVGADGVFSVADRRVLYGSFGNTNLKEVWQFYYEDRAKYEKLCRIKEKFDPKKVFSPNPFCVENMK